jgi:hypothetical protein
VETFKGQLHYRCAMEGFVETAGHPSLPEVAYVAPTSARRLKGGSSGVIVWGEQAEWDTGDACNPLLGGPDSHPQCDEGQRCMYFDHNPQHDLMSFDHSGVAFVALLQAITFDDWTVAMYALMRAMSPWVFVYFVAIVILGGFFVINLFLAVIFEETLEAQLRDQIMAEAPKVSRATTAPSRARARRRCPAAIACCVSVADACGWNRPRSARPLPEPPPVARRRCRSAARRARAPPVSDAVARASRSPFCSSPKSSRSTRRR